MPDLNDIKTVKHVKHMSLHVILRSNPQPHAQLAYQILIQVKDQPLCRVKRRVCLWYWVPEYPEMEG